MKTIDEKTIEEVAVIVEEMTEESEIAEEIGLGEMMISVAAITVEVTMTDDRRTIVAVERIEETRKVLTRIMTGHAPSAIMPIFHSELNVIDVELPKGEVGKEIVVGRVMIDGRVTVEKHLNLVLVIGFVRNVENQTSLKEMNASVVVNLRGLEDQNLVATLEN